MYVTSILIHGKMPLKTIRMEINCLQRSSRARQREIGTPRQTPSCMEGVPTLLANPTPQMVTNAARAIDYACLELDCIAKPEDSNNNINNK